MPFEAYYNTLHDPTNSIQNSRKRHFEEHSNFEIPCPQCFLRTERGASKDINLNEL
jgi:hypothetical protein